MGEPKTERISVRVTPAEKQMAVELAEERGLDVGDIVRMLLREEHARAKAKKAKR